MTTRYSYLSSANNLFLQGRDITVCDTEAVCEAAAEGDLSMMRYLTFQGINIYIREALAYAAMNGHLKMVKFLSKMAGNTFKARCYDFALTVAAKGNHLSVVRFLKDKYAEGTAFQLVLAIGGAGTPSISSLSVAEYLLDSHAGQNLSIRSEEVLACIEEYRAGKESLESLLLASWGGNSTRLVANYL